MYRLMILILLPTHLSAQIVFEQVYGGTDSELGFGVEQTTDGGFILSGVTWSQGNGSGDMYLVKTDDVGTVQWSRTFGTINLDIGYAVKQTTDGGFAVCGMFNGFGSDTLTLVRTAAGGNTLWEHQYPGSLGRDLGYAVQQTEDGGFVICGSSGPSLDDAYVVRTDLNGNLVWDSTIDLGGLEMAMAIEQTDDNGSIVLVQNSGVNDPLSEIFLLRFDDNGDTLWSRMFATTGPDEARGLAITDDGGFIVAAGNGYPKRDIQLIRTDAQGLEQWRQLIGNPILDELASGIQQMEDGGFILGGRKENVNTGNIEMLLLKTDANGIVEWERIFPRGLFCEAQAIDRTSDGGFALFGTTTDVIDDVAYSDMYLVKTDGAGNAAIENVLQNESPLLTFPNPATDHLWVELPMNTIRAVSLVDPTGRVVLDQSKTGIGAVELVVSGMATGLYVLHVTDRTGRIQSQHVVISR